MSSTAKPSRDGDREGTYGKGEQWQEEVEADLDAQAPRLHDPGEQVCAGVDLRKPVEVEDVAGVVHLDGAEHEDGHREHEPVGGQDAQGAAPVEVAEAWRGPVGEMCRHERAVKQEAR